MKRCPACHNTYADDSLVYCLKDGTTLVGDFPSSSTTQETLINPMLPAYEERTVTAGALQYHADTGKKRRSSPVIIAFVALAAIAAAALIYFLTRGSTESSQRTTAVSSASGAPAANSTTTPALRSTPTPSQSPEMTAEAPPEATEEAATPEATPTATPEPSNNAGKLKQEAEFFTFEIKQCRLSGSTVICDMVITNTDVDRVLGLGGRTKMFDDSGSEYNAKQVQVANKEGYEVWPTLINGVPTKGRFTFEGVNPQATRISLLDIYGVPRGGEAFDLQFRNIPLKK